MIQDIHIYALLLLRANTFLLTYLRMLGLDINDERSTRVLKKYKDRFTLKMRDGISERFDEVIYLYFHCNNLYPPNVIYLISIFVFPVIISYQIFSKCINATDTVKQTEKLIDDLTTVLDDVSPRFPER